MLIRKKDTGSYANWILPSHDMFKDRRFTRRLRADNGNLRQVNGLLPNSSKNILKLVG
jgi:hypothetical protein